MTGEVISLRQGQQSVIDFAVDFAFLHRLADHIRDLMTYPRPPTLDGMINLALKVDQQLMNHRLPTAMSYQGLLPP